ncbi:DUF397 domain-containing protein [Streptomyces sp. NPDC013455]|uniref:DUF397 domain-containing protein n=1 Tax=Streptomyces sp. NPDC013455 TaxID=3155605 RepID=UPI0033E4E41D
MNSPDLTNAQWYKSSYSSGQGACVEVAHLPGAVATQDSKDPGGPALVFTRDGWKSFLDGIDAGDFGG